MPQAAAVNHAPSPSPAELANAIRALAMDAVEAAKSGHPGMPMGMADVATVLYSKFLKFDPKQPNWADRDRFILSAGHGSMLLYALNFLTGYEKMTMEQLKKFRQLHALTAGHPEVMVEAGIETTTGPLGQGIATSVGFALAERMLNARFGNDLVDHHTYVIASDGDLMEGISHEAASLAGHLKLGRLIVLYDDNNISIDGATSLSFTDDSLKRFESYGWHTSQVDGHDVNAIEKAIAAAKADPRPSIISCKTIIGYGAPKKGGTKDCHGSPLGAEEVAATRVKLGWNSSAFDVPDTILQEWRSYGAKGKSTREGWEKRLQASAKKAEFEAAMAGKVPDAAYAALSALKEKVAAEKPKVATRQSSGMALEVLLPALTELVGGSADLTPSNNTQVKGFEDVKPGAYGGRYIRYGVREHGMAACMNGLALHGGIIPYGGTFMQFADYCRPSIRLSALMKQRVVYIMTHDSIGLGEDGPTHQPVEHLAALRAIPNLLTMRPCDTVETAECWEVALKKQNGPSLLALSRQNLPTLRGAEKENRAAKGGYVLAGGEKRKVTIIATGSEVSLAMEARTKLAEQGIEAAVVSMPCTELFDAQDDNYRSSVLGDAPRIVVEAAVRLGWDRYLRANDAFVGMKSFGESAPAPDVYKHFGITVDAVVAAAKRLSA
jgi:transketolase